MTDTATKTTVWAIDTAHSSVEFSVKHLVFATAKGRFSDVKGTITVRQREHRELERRYRNRRRQCPHE